MRTPVRNLIFPGKISHQFVNWFEMTAGMPIPLVGAGVPTARCRGIHKSGSNKLHPYIPAPTFNPVRRGGARRVKQTSRGLVCSPSGEQSAIATWDCPARRLNPEKREGQVRPLFASKIRCALGCGACPGVIPSAPPAGGPDPRTGGRSRGCRTRCTPPPGPGRGRCGPRRGPGRGRCRRRDPPRPP